MDQLLRCLNGNGNANCCLCPRLCRPLRLPLAVASCDLSFVLSLPCMLTTGTPYLIHSQLAARLVRVRLSFKVRVQDRGIGGLVYEHYHPQKYRQKCVRCSLIFPYPSTIRFRVEVMVKRMYQPMCRGCPPTELPSERLIMG